MILSTHFFHANGNILDLYPDNSTGKSIIKKIITQTKYSQNILFIKRTSECQICYGFVFYLTGNESIGFYINTNEFIFNIKSIFRTFTNAIKQFSKAKENTATSIQQNRQTVDTILNHLTQKFNTLPYASASTLGTPDLGYDTKEKIYANHLIKSGELLQQVKSGKYVVIIGSYIDYHPVDITSKHPLCGTQKIDNHSPLNGTEPIGKNINCTAYIFLNVNGSYWQYPLDYTKNIFHKAATISQRDCSLIIKRDRNMAYYVYMYDRNDTNNYKGLCVAVNGIMFQEITQIFQSFKKASEVLSAKVSPSKILKQLIQEFSNFKYTKLPVLKYSIENDHINKFNYTDIISNKNKLSLHNNGYTLIIPEAKPLPQSTATSQDEKDKTEKPQKKDDGDGCSGCLGLLWFSFWIFIIADGIFNDGEKFANYFLYNSKNNLRIHFFV